MSRIVVYSQQGCPNCDRLTRKLDDLGIDYTKLMIDLDYKAKAKLVASGIKSVPALGIDDKPPFPGSVEDLVAIAISLLRIIKKE